MQAETAFEQLAHGYEKLLTPGKLARMNLFFVRAALAIIHRLLDHLELAKEYWERAAKAAKERGWRPGFAEMIITYSMGEIMLSRCAAETMKLVEKAKLLFN